MHSIRLSLLVYFLLLVTASLGVASFLVYNVLRSTLLAKEQAEANFVEAQYKERCDEARAQLDFRLLANAKSLAGRVRPHIQWLNDSAAESWLSMTTTFGGGPGGPLNSLIWWMQVPRDRRAGRWMMPVQFQLHRGHQFSLDFGKEVEPPQEDPRELRVSSLIQTNNYSRPMPPRGELRLPDEAKFAPRDRFNWVYDDVVLSDGTAARRVRFRSLIRFEEGGPGGPPPPPPGAPRTTFIVPRAAIIIQCAASLNDLETALLPLREQRDAELVRIRAETATALSRQRAGLLLLCGLTFGATILGCFVLVWIGLRPLRRLSDAVSEITPRNFSLSLGGGPMPVELQPIAERLGVTLDLLRRAFIREKQATADISHELRTPLAALLTTIELALRRNRSPEQYREMLQECHGSATHMHQIVERLLTLARLDAGVDRLRARAVDVGDLAEQCATVVRPLAEARGLRLSVVNACPAGVGEGEAMLTTDPDKLREVLNNLLHNAVQYNRPDGRIDLVVGRDGGCVRVEVRDTGIGIAAEAKERIFERFYRADPSRACDGLNAGLGLAIVKEYVDLMGGHISVESAPGQGSTFRVELPVQAPASAA